MTQVRRGVLDIIKNLGFQVILYVWGFSRAFFRYGKARHFYIGGYTDADEKILFFYSNLIYFP